MYYTALSQNVEISVGILTQRPFTYAEKKSKGMSSKLEILKLKKGEIRKF